MFEVIVAVDKNYGIGKYNKMPWKCKEELKIFKDKTINNIVIFGRKTYENLPLLENRIVIPLSRRNKLSFNNIFDVYPGLKDSNKTIFVAGGRDIYKLAFENKFVERIHISFMNNVYDCDTYFDKKWLDNFIITEEYKSDLFTHFVMEPTEYGEIQYTNILKDVLNGTEKKGRNGSTISKFGKNLMFDLRKGFPLLTTKKMFFRGIVEELLFFLKGDTNSKILENKNINIWKGNTSRQFIDSIGKYERKEGLMGPMYGYQFRHANAKYNETTGCPEEEGIDQLSEVIDMIRNDPNSRRILMTSYNINQVKDGVLYPCHSLILQFSVEGKHLDMFCYNRSSDLFLGLPFNIASSSLLLEIVAKITNLTARNFYLSLGDCHIYKNHIQPVLKQLERIPYAFPKLVIDKKLVSIDNIENLEYKDFNLINYKHHEKILADMIP